MRWPDFYIAIEMIQKIAPTMGSTAALSECASGSKVKMDGKLVDSGVPPPCICSMAGFWIVWVQNTVRPHVATDPQVAAHGQGAV
jgi:hypothetical protein